MKTNNETMQKNISSIINIVNNITSGIETNSNQRNELIVSIQEAVKNEYFTLLFDRNYKNRNKDDYKSDKVRIEKLLTIDTNVLKQVRTDFQENYLQVNWNSADLKDKARIQALRDSFNAYVPIYLYELKKKTKDTLFKKGNSYFTGNNNSLIRVRGQFIYDNLKSLNPTNDTDKSLNFSQLSRVCNAFIKSGDNNMEGSRTNPFDQKIKNITADINKDKDAENPFTMGSADTQSNISKLIVAGNNWLSALRQARLNQVQEKSGFNQAEIKKKKAS
tara:strand:+ start:548 stop:1375 length:828 start_codon:yes stop_codon:yes gene_type:complete